MGSRGLRETGLGAGGMHQAQARDCKSSRAEASSHEHGSMRGWIHLH
ncbi:MAG: hypothetical protein OEW48_04845 [Phycisphaerae bacterium]|nr:hypothetical protein [Phycisphaerae bacterium]